MACVCGQGWVPASKERPRLPASALPSGCWAVSGCEGARRLPPLHTSAERAQPPDPALFSTAEAARGAGTGAAVAAAGRTSGGAARSSRAGRAARPAPPSPPLRCGTSARTAQTFSARTGGGPPLPPSRAADPGRPRHGPGPGARRVSAEALPPRPPASSRPRLTPRSPFASPQGAAAAAGAAAVSARRAGERGKCCRVPRRPATLRGKRRGDAGARSPHQPARDVRDPGPTPNSRLRSRNVL